MVNRDQVVDPQNGCRSDEVSLFLERSSGSGSGSPSARALIPFQRVLQPSRGPLLLALAFMTSFRPASGTRTSELHRRLLFPGLPASSPIPPLLPDASPELNAELYDFIALALRAYVHPWWSVALLSERFLTKAEICTGQNLRVMIVIFSHRSLKSLPPSFEHWPFGCRLLASLRCCFLHYLCALSNTTQIFASVVQSLVLRMHKVAPSRCPHSSMPRKHILASMLKGGSNQSMYGRFSSSSLGHAFLKKIEKANARDLSCAKS